MSRSLPYRYDIDGLRALAVLAVVAYHIIPWIFPGGFVGVDVFFVISGYLITRNIWKELESDHFSFLNFYAKRIRRLFPALMVVLLFCALLVTLFGLPDETHLFGLSAISSTLYVSNHYFLSLNSYFDSSLEANPLLHTWSLSVEEQFYIVFPFFIFLLFKRARKKTTQIIIGVLIASLVFSEVMTNANQPAAFFLAPSRFWQFLAGALLALNPSKKLLPRPVMELIGWVGLGLIVISILTFSEYTPFPGLYAIVPTLGTVGLLYAGQSSGLLLASMLKNRIARFFGNISYSLYLWHWPLIVFYKLELSPEPSTMERYALVAVSIMMGYLSWQFIEQPFRKFSVSRYRQRIYYYGAAASVVLVFIGIWFVTTDGIKSRYSSDQLVFVDYLEYDADASFRTDTCFLTSNVNGAEAFDEENCLEVDNGRPNILLIGDSHAAQYFAAFEKVIPQATFSQVTASGCRPLINYKGASRCTDLMRKAFEEYIEYEKFDAIVLAGRWQRNDLNALPETIQYLNNRTENVIVLGPVIEYRQALPRILAKNGPDEEILKSARRYAGVKTIDERVQHILAPLDVQYYSILEIMCPENECIIQTSDGMPIQFDASHLTLQGAIEIVEAIVEKGFVVELSKFSQKG